MDIGISYPVERAKPIIPTIFSSTRLGITYIAAALIMLDSVVVSGGGHLTAVLYSKATGLASDPAHARDFMTSATHMSLIAGLISPLVLARKSSIADGRRMTKVIRTGTSSLAVLMGLILTIGFIVGAWNFTPTPWISLWFATIAVLTLGGRLMLFNLVDSTRFQRVFRRRVAVVCEPSAIEQVMHHLRDGGEQSMEFVGVFHDQAVPSNRNLTALIELGKLYPLDCIILAIPADDHRLNRAIDRLKALNVEIVYYPGWSDNRRSEWRADSLGNLPVYKIVRRPISGFGLLLKSIEDKLLATILLIALAPVMFIIAVMIRLDSPGPIIFRQKRNGLNNTEFDILKFRTMQHDYDGAQKTVQQTRRNDSRVTAVGRMLRSTSLDELPQLLNVLRGEMSLVGPRPHPISMRTENRSGEEISVEYPHRHRVKPGITGWAQVNGFRGATDTVSEMARRVEYDIFYIDHWSLLFDLRILVMTPIKVMVDRDRAY